MATSRVPTMQFKKTKLCKFEQMGRCTKGPMCQFAHGAKELRSSPDLRFTRLCKTVLLGGCCQDESCTYAHSKDELRSVGQRSKAGRSVQSGTKACALDVPPSFMEIESWQVTPQPWLDFDSGRDAMFSKSGVGAAGFVRQYSPAYVPLPSILDTPAFETSPHLSSQQGKVIRSKFDSVMSDGTSVSTQAPLTPPTPPSPPSPMNEVDDRMGFYPENVSNLVATVPDNLVATVPGFLDAPLRLPGLKGLGPFCTHATAGVSNNETYFGLGILDSGSSEIFAPLKGSMAKESVQDIWSF